MALALVLCAAIPSLSRGQSVPPPTQAPAVAVQVSTGQMVLTWTPVTGITWYRVFRAVNGVWSTTPVATVAQTGYLSTGLANSTLYTFKVAALNEGGLGPYSNNVQGTPLALPTIQSATPGDHQITLTWSAVGGAAAYEIYRRASDAGFVLIGPAVVGSTLVDTGLTNGTQYSYRVRAISPTGASSFSDAVGATPAAAPQPQLQPPAAAPGNVSAAPTTGQVTLTWNPLPDASTYRIYRAVSSGPFSLLTTVAATPYRDLGLTNGTPYSYRIAGHNEAGDGPASAAVTATPQAVPNAPTNLSATGGTALITLAWTPVSGATSYRVYRGTASKAQEPVPLATGLTTSAFVDTAVADGTYYYYRVTALAGSVEGGGSGEASASTAGSAPVVDLATVAAFRLLRHATWGARAGDVERVRQTGADAFLAEQFAAPPSLYPAVLFDQPLGVSQQQFLAFALNGQDQLRQRVTWALHKIWVVSGMEVNNTGAVLAYYATVQNGAFGNYRDLMRAVTLNPAMGRYLNMINSRSQAVTGVPANENYARELMQLFTIGTSRLQPDGTPMLDGGGAPVPAYTEADVKALARILTGWTFGDGNSSTIPTKAAAENWRVPMEPVARFHDVTAKTFLGEDFPAAQTATQDLDHALDVLFEHPNLAPFVSRQLIQQLVTSNPSPGYVAAVAAVFNGASGGARGDIAAVVRAVLTHPEANVVTPQSGKLSEPLLLATSVLRAVNATVADYAVLSDRLVAMGQIPFYPTSVFSYFSPGYKVRGTGTPPLVGPEFQLLTTATAFERVNFIASLVSDYFSPAITVDWAPFTALAANAAVLVDACNTHFLGGAMTADARMEIINAVNATPPGNPSERVRTALYLTLVTGQGQVDR
jgi:fibronectin type 3 domain-containing protein